MGRALKLLLPGVAAVLWNVPARAVDGVVEINQAAVFAGGVTAGDMPGFPATLNQSGSYRLTGNLDVAKAADGSAQANAQNVTAIEIIAANVTVDLNGFSILGPVQCDGGVPVTGCMPSGGTGVGISGSNSGGNATIRNGTVRGMGNSGVVLRDNARVEGIHAISNGLNGIFTGGRSDVSHCTASLNGGTGISVIGTATGNTVTGNGQIGINGSHTVLIGNIAVDNGGVGLGMGSLSGYTNNVVNGNNGGNANPQTSGGVEMPPNVCGGNLVCP